MTSERYFELKFFSYQYEHFKEVVESYGYSKPSFGVKSGYTDKLSEYLECRNKLDILNKALERSGHKTIKEALRNPKFFYILDELRS